MEIKSYHDFFSFSLINPRIKKIEIETIPSPSVLYNMSLQFVNQMPSPSPSPAVWASPSPLPSKSANHNRKLWAPSWGDILHVSRDQEGDEYDRLGRNVSAQERRQELEPWVLVDRGGLDDNMSSYGD